MPFKTSQPSPSEKPPIKFPAADPAQPVRLAPLGG
jgi:hypothetical protein